MLENYLPVLIFLIIGLMVGVGAMFVGGFVLAPSKPDEAKNSPFECCVEAFEDSRMKFDVRYNLGAIQFIIDDLEIAFLYPWAVVLSENGRVGILAMGIFRGILVSGFRDEWTR